MIAITPNPSVTGHYTVKWNAAARADRYELQQSISSGAWTMVSNQLTGTQWSPPQARPNGTYSYRVRGINLYGEGAWPVTSSQIKVQIPTELPMTVPGNFRVNFTTVRPGGKYKFEWDRVSGAVTYKVTQTYSNCPGHAQTIWDLPENTPQPWQLTGSIPPCGTTPAPSHAKFQYTIQACSTTQCSEKSPSITVTVSQIEARAAGPTYYHTDALGSPVVQTDAAGQPIADSRRHYEPYGKLLRDLVPADQGPGYTGHVTDVLSGFSYMQQRYYDPLAGRFLSVDPVVANTTDGSNFNRYWYANNNPYKFTDSDGRLPDCAPRCTPDEVKAYTDAKALVVIKLWAVPAAAGATSAVGAATGLTAEAVVGAKAAWRYATSDEGKRALCLATALGCVNPAEVPRGNAGPPKRKPEIDVVKDLERRQRINRSVDKSIEGEKLGNSVEPTSGGSRRIPSPRAYRCRAVKAELERRMIVNTLSDDLYDRVIDLFRSGNSVEGARIVDEEINKSPPSEEGIHLRLIRAQALEFGGWGGPIDLERARADYCELMEHKDSLGTNIPLGLARTLYKLNHEAHITEVRELLNYVIEREQNPHAYMLRGMATEDVKRDHRMARLDYWRAFALGLPWGMRYIARSYWASHSYIRGALAHCIATISAPLLLWRHGPRGVLYEDFDREFYGTARNK